MCVALPVLLGRSGQARRLLRELAARQADHIRSQERRGIDRELWYVAATPLGDLLIGFVGCHDFERAGELLAASRDDFDLWLQSGVRQATGIDLSRIPDTALPELLVSPAISNAQEESTHV